jgi:protein-L-isoaspartate(D-aspartate) O-methyltransferase
MSGTDFQTLRRAMVSNQLRTNKVSDAAVLAAMGEVPRELFVAEGQGGVAYRDTIVPLGGGRGLNPPIATGRLLDAGSPTAGERVLVVGAATGYTAAVLAVMGCTVTALEADPALVARAKAGPAGATIVEGPLAAGWPAKAPYDLICIDGCVDAIPPALVEQLADGGRIVAGVNDHGVCRLVAGRKAGEGFGAYAFADVEAVPLPGFAPAPAFTF